MSFTLPLSIACIFAAAFLAPTVHRRMGRGSGWVLALAPVASFLLLVLALPVGDHAAITEARFSWFDSLAVTLDFRLDGLAALMALLVTGVGALIVVYAGGYLQGHPQLGRFYLYLLAFMGSMLGLVLSEHLIVLFVFWELTSITSYLLIGFKHEERDSRWKALQALLVTGLGAMGMLVGFILIGLNTGTFLISEINLLGDSLRASGQYPAIIGCILLGAFTKSAQVPFHFWLPNAMAAPTPVSAFLHSATMVKAGVFLLARLNPALAGGALWSNSLILFGGATFLMAVFLGLWNRDLKGILAYTTLAVLGLLTFLIGIGTPLALKAMVLFLVAHVFYKAALFMTAGSVDHACGTRDVRRLRGLRRFMPWTTAAALLAVLSMCGLPPFFGFIGKEVIYEAGLHLPGSERALLLVAVVGNFVMMGLALCAGFAPFWKGGAPDIEGHPHEAPPSMWLGPLLLGALGLLFGLAPALVDASFLAPAVAAVKGTDVKPLDLHLWHGFNAALLLSLATVALGLATFLLRERFWSKADAVVGFIRARGAEAAYERVFNAVVALSKWQTARLQTGRLHDYVFCIAASATALVGWALFQVADRLPAVQAAGFDPWIMALVLLMMAAALMVLLSDRYFLILGALGTIGFGIALLFAYYGAPDLAITQLMVEALTVVLFMLVIYGLPSIRRFSGGWTMGRDAILSGIFGLVVALLAWMAVDLQFGPAISDTLAAMSYPEAKGKNVVNVILVDFRALDTFGEITVVASAALGIAALMSSRASRGFKKEGGGE